MAISVQNLQMAIVDSWCKGVHLTELIWNSILVIWSTLIKSSVTGVKGASSPCIEYVSCFPIPARFVVSCGGGPWGGSGRRRVSKVPEELHGVCYFSHSLEGYICICGVGLLWCINPHCQGTNQSSHCIYIHNILLLHCKINVK